LSDDRALSDLQRDALTEVVNIGVSRAAVGLRKMVGEQVIMSVPSLELISRHAATQLIRERESDQLVAVCQDFDGPFSGRALLIFPAASSLSLVHAVAGDAVAAEDLWSLEDEALAETGNIVLNGCLASMANMLKQHFSLSLPKVVRGDGRMLFEAPAGGKPSGMVLFLYINFTLSDRAIRGYIAMMMDLPSIVVLRDMVDEFIARVVGSDDPDEAFDQDSAKIVE
jgi:chemotaxis protein CheC